ncbi:MAG: TetR family transcriptional regulator C-terminal domain-containing protein [Defluviimonas sp.]|uniref:TetR family transcriptional regulator C-terminal domain-containing protein n=1 Tax=Albidovulum sp. TaxID=1872424 RepID=UPI001DB47951|nr:TetR family transcriptional regulator C-terminal domain-containing protein [Paracoccaceae bacterium]MCC0064150.1 TetR family transcriptional regulator C-terminal domain-containing protein [Defluviimonas sp.]
MTETAPAAPGTRVAMKEHHRQVLIDAAADAILQHGLAGVSVSKIVDRAQLSRGMVNLHFSSKTKLLQAVAQKFSDEYVSNWQRAMAAAGEDPAERLRAIISADFDPVVLNRRTMAVWMAFRGEAQSTTDYLPYIDSRDRRMRSAIHDICAELAADGPYPDINPSYAALALMALLEGLWTDFHLHPDVFKRDEARRIVLHTARALFPRHFTAG